MLETEYSSPGVNTKLVNALAPKVARASADMALAVVGQTTCIVVPELISSTWDKPNRAYNSKCEYIFWNLEHNSAC